MKKTTFALFTLLVFGVFAGNAQSVGTMQKTLDTATDVCQKLDLYTAIAKNLVQFDQPKTREITYAEAGKAVDYVLKAIHINSQDGDYYALRTDYDLLTQAYLIQKKYTQAKWFNLQSNNISRNLHDMSHVIWSLIEMATIKSAIKDYKLAQQDLDEAMLVAKNTYNLILQIEVERNMAILYDKTGNTKQAIAMQKHYSMLLANLKIAQTPTAVLAMQKKQKAKAKTKLPAIAKASVKPAATQKTTAADGKLNPENGVAVVKD
ncbi:tetratricopeptide repeat protein [Mucilaginibacter sp. AW1-3]